MNSSGGSGRGSPKSGASTETVELSSEFQAELRDLARALPQLNYYELLGIDQEADDAAVRNAFFERSKCFHPDRHFKKQVGAYGPLLTEIYKKVVAANDVLRDPDLRKSYDRLLAEGGTLHRRSAPGETPPCNRAVSKHEPPAGPSLRDRQGLQSRQNLLHGLERQLEQSRSKARKHFEQALTYKEAGNWGRALSLLKHALAFDPRDQDIHDELAEVVLQANAKRGEEALSRGRAMLKRGEHEAAMEMLAEASQLRPTDVELAETVAELLCEARKWKEAREFAERAVALEGDSVRGFKVLGQVFKAKGDVAKARKHLQRAWELDPMDPEVRAELQTL